MTEKKKFNKKIIFIGIIIAVLIGISFFSYQFFSRRIVHEEYYLQFERQYTKVIKTIAKNQENYEESSIREIDYTEYKYLKEEYQLDRSLKESYFEKYKIIAIKIFGTEKEIKSIDYKFYYEDEGLTFVFNIDNECDSSYELDINYIYFVFVPKEIDTEHLHIDYDYKEYCNSKNGNEVILEKPILYLYPEYTMNISIKLQNESLLKTTYPKYINGWNIIVEKDGTITDQNNKKYYALYWDEQNQNTIDFEEGFYVTKDNAIEFLESTLTKIGLNYKEKNEFIMYWLPILEQNEQSIVYYELTEEREQNNKLLIEPIPDSLLRIVIHIKKVNQATPIKEQELDTFERKGFVAVEWGGIKYD